MHQLNQAATFAASTVLIVFGLTCWQLEGRPFDPPMKAEQAAYAVRQVDHFGGKFGIRGPQTLRASAEGKWIARGYEYVLPVSAVAR
jgi:hypothetical protein